MDLQTPTAKPQEDLETDQLCSSLSLGFQQTLQGLIVAPKILDKFLLLLYLLGETVSAGLHGSDESLLPFPEAPGQGQSPQRARLLLLACTASQQNGTRKLD